MLVIAYHANGYPFACTDGVARWSYYGIGGTPIIQIDGNNQEVGGVSMPGTMYPIYRRWVTQRLAVSSPLTIDLSCSYDTVANTGTVTASITNTSTSSVSGTLQFAVVENNIPYSWYGLTTVEHVCRDMLPDANGEAVTIPAGGNIVRNRNFTIDATWNEQNCKIVTFVQGSTKEIYQAGEVGVTGKINMDYYGLRFTETSGNGNRIAQPGEAIRAYIFGKNNGNGTYTGGATISTSDPYITITSSNPQTVSIGPGDVDTVLITNFNISSSCPTPRTVQFLLNFGTPGDTNRINFVVTNQPGFTDNIESGQGSWTHSGGNDNWHITTHKSNSPTHSWYCGVEGSWQYTNLNDASLVSPYFVATPDSSLRFWHTYATEVDYDYSYCEIDNNCGWWQILGIYNGTQSSWTQMNYPLVSYAGQTVRLRYRFCSDQSVVAEGWYIDDISVPTIVGIDENSSGKLSQEFTVLPNPFKRNVVIRWQDFEVERSKEKIASIKIFDASGRTVKQYNHLTTQPFNQVVWSGNDDSGQHLPAGVYFINLSAGDKNLMQKVIMLE